jgi:zinc finger protein CONSTANS
VARYRRKRARRQFKKMIRYATRKAYAEVRPRIKGRFVKKVRARGELLERGCGGLMCE